jgi:hypothetical protein
MISDSVYAYRTFEERILFYKKIYEDGLLEVEAMNELWPLRDASGNRQNTNRTTRVCTWIRRKLFPPTGRELAKARDMGLLKADDEINLDDALKERAAGVLVWMVRDSTLSAEKAEHWPPIVKKEKLAFQVPLETAARLRALGGNRSKHLRKALQLYLDVSEERSH